MQSQVTRDRGKFNRRGCDVTTVQERRDVVTGEGIAAVQGYREVRHRFSPGLCRKVLLTFRFQSSDGDD